MPQVVIKMSTQKQRTKIAIVMAMPAMACFWYYTSWQATLALFVLLWADNIDKDR